MTIAEFLLARIANEEAMAKQVIAEQQRDASRSPGDFPENYDPSADFYFGSADGPIGYVVVVVGAGRVLAECEAKRRIVAMHHDLDGGAPETYPYQSADGRTIWPGCAVCDEGSPSRPHCDTIRTLATVYADHPDYDESWRP